MFTQLAQLLEKNNRLVITIDSHGDNMAVSIASSIPVPNSDKAHALQNALAKPVTYQGSPEELDAELVPALTSYVEAFQSQVSNIDSVTEEVVNAKANKGKSEKSSSDKKTPAKAPASAKSTQATKPATNASAHTVDINSL